MRNDSLPRAVARGRGFAVSGPRFYVYDDDRREALAWAAALGETAREAARAAARRASARETSPQDTLRPSG